MLYNFNHNHNQSEDMKEAEKLIRREEKYTIVKRDGIDVRVKLVDTRFIDMIETIKTIFKRDLNELFVTKKKSIDDEDEGDHYKLERAK